MRGTKKMKSHRKCKFFFEGKNHGGICLILGSYIVEPERREFKCDSYKEKKDEKMDEKEQSKVTTPK